MGFGTVIFSILAIIVAIALVSALAFGFIYLLKLWQDRSLGANESGSSALSMRFVRTLPLGASERIVLVEVGDETLLLGVAGGGVTLLKSWSIDSLPPTMSDGGDTEAISLAARFRQLPQLRKGGRA